MFYLRLNKVRILNNREMLGKAEMQLFSFVSGAESDFSMLRSFFKVSAEDQKREIVKEAIGKMTTLKKFPLITKVKDKSTIYFGDTGYVVFKSITTPDDLSWVLLAIELDEKTRKNADIVGAILTDDTISKAVNAISLLAGLANPVAGAITELGSIVAKALVKVFKNDQDDQAGLLLTSFTKAEHYPHGKRDKEDAPDVTGNMFVDYTIFSAEE